MTISITQTGGKVTHVSNTFEVTTSYTDMVVTAMNGDLVVAPGAQTNHGEYEQGRMSVHILNAQGMEVRGFSMSGSTTIDVSDLPAGIYFVNVIGGQVVTKKIIVE